MRWLLFSDTHGSIKEAAILIERFASQVDGVLHMGDYERDCDFLDKQYRYTYDLSFAGVPGNCDLGSRSPRSRLFHVEGRCVMMCHGDRYHVNDGLEYLDLAAREAGADVVLFGHTHMPLQVEKDGILFVNSGSLTEPRGWTKRSFGILEIEKGKAAANLLDYDPFDL